MRICVQNQINQLDFLPQLKLISLNWSMIYNFRSTYIASSYRPNREIHLQLWKVIAKYLKPPCKNKYFIDDTLAFPDLLKNAEESDDYKVVSNDVESFYLCIFQLKKWLAIIQNIYVKEIKPFCKKSIFTKLLKKLNSRMCVFN